MKLFCTGLLVIPTVFGFSPWTFFLPESITPSSSNDRLCHPRGTGSAISASNTQVGDCLNGTNGTEKTMSDNSRDVIRNFRRVGGLPSDVPLYRCANTDGLADCIRKKNGPCLCAETDIMLNKAGLIIDLRSDSERDVAKAAAWMASAPGGKFTVQRNNLMLLENTTTTKRQRTVLRLDPLHPAAFMEYLENNWLSGPAKLRGAMYKIFDGDALHSLRMKCLNEKGLTGLNEAILETGKRDMLAALQAMTIYWEKYPGTVIVFHCVQGKDRTGLLSMLCQSILGCTDQEIVADYHLSEKNLQPRSGSAAAEDALQGSNNRKPKSSSRKLDRNFFSGSPAHVMVETLAWVRTKYGSVSPGYLNAIGFDEGWRRRYCAAVAAGVSSNDVSVGSRL